MRAWLPALLLSLLAASAANSALALDPTGEWETEKGDAHIRIVDCGGRLWGVVSWAKIPGYDIHNPDRFDAQPPDGGHARAAEHEARRRPRNVGGRGLQCQKRPYV